MALGMRRLSIIDLAIGHHPIGNEDETTWICVNGEVYNVARLVDEPLAGRRDNRSSSGPC